ncbi:MAG: hypothetical protein ACI37Z_08960 [Candidatus Gastranaerophilaceae bacterium]
MVFEKEQSIIASINFALNVNDDNIPTTQEDLIVIKEALEKREKKELKTQTVNRGIGVSGEYDISYDYLCPCCEAVVGNYETDDIFYIFCPECGQRLK